MIAMAVVSHQCVAGNERGNSSMEEGEDLLNRLRYLRQTLQDCHVRVSALDERVESIHSLEDVSTPVKKVVDENGRSAKQPQMLYGFVDGSQTREDPDKSEELENDHLLQNVESDFEQYSPSTELQSCLTDNHLKHLAQKHASELLNIYWSYSADKKYGQECSSEKKQVKKVVTWSDDYEIFPYYSETCEQNGTEHLEVFATSHEYDDVDEALVEFDMNDESSDGLNGNGREVDEDLMDEDKYNHMQMDDVLTNTTEKHERITDVDTTASDFKNINNYGSDIYETLVDERTEAERKETVSLSILNDIKNPWFKKARVVNEDSGERMHFKRRRHTLIRTKKIDVDDHNVEHPTKTDEYLPEESLFEKFNQCKSEEDTERAEDSRILRESNEITFEDVSTCKVILGEMNDEMSTCTDQSDLLENGEKSDKESFEFKVLSTKEMESDYASDNSMYGYNSEDEISVSKTLTISEATLPKTDNTPEAKGICDSKRKFFGQCIFYDDDEFSNFQDPPYIKSSSQISGSENKSNMINNTVDIAKLRINRDMPDVSVVSNDSLKVNSIELLELIKKKLCHLADDVPNNIDSSGEECSEHIKSSSSLRTHQGCNTDPVLNQYSSWDPKSLITMFLMLLLLIAALFVIYLIIAVPLLVVTIRHNGSSVAI